MPVPGNLLTTAMAVMPHADADAALELALSLDAPFWPQLPNLSYREDMYVQASENFPGILLDLENRKLGFDINKFYEELPAALERWESDEFFDISADYSVVYHKFLKMDLADRPAIRGQLEGPISFGFNVNDQDGRPIIFDDNVRPFMLDFMARRLNAQMKRLKKKNDNAFMYVDEPGLQFVWSALSGYGDAAARRDLDDFLAKVERPRGIHLCGNPDWQFMLNLDLDVLSMDIYTNGEVFAAHASAIRRFLDGGGVLVWGIVPANVEPFTKENMYSLVTRLEEVWTSLQKKGIDRDLIVRNSMLSAATCCLVNPDVTVTVERAFETILEMSRLLRKENGLD